MKSYLPGKETITEKNGMVVYSNTLRVSLMGDHPGDIGLFQIIPDLCTTIALVILIRISIE